MNYPLQNALLKTPKIDACVKSIFLAKNIISYC